MRHLLKKTSRLSSKPERVFMNRYWLHIGCCLAFLGAGIQSISSQEIVPKQEINIDDLGDVSDEFQENFFEALKQKAITNYEKAITALEKCIEIDPRLNFLYGELGKNYAALKKYDLAATNFKKVLEEQPNDRFVLEQLFEVYFTQGNYTSATEVVEKLVAFDIIYKEQLANLYFLDKKYDKALTMLNSLIDEIGTDKYREQLRKKITLKISNPNSQIARLEQKIADSPKEEQNYLNLIYLYSKNNQKEKAFETAEKLLKKKPKSKLVHLALYKFYLDDGAIDKAIKSMKIALSSDELEGDSKYKVINDFLIFVDKNPGYEKELIEITNVFSDDTGSTKVFTEIGNYFYEKDKKELALNYYERGIKDSFQSFDVLRKVLLLQLDLKRYEKAKEGSTLAIELYPSQPILYLVNGVSLVHLTNYEEAIDILSVGIDYVIDDLKMESDFYNQIAEAYLKKGDTVKAAQYKEKSLQLKKKS